MDEIQKELKTRRRITGIYNKSRSDFATKEAWDDYLEELEDIIFNLVNNIDIRETEAKVKAYEAANRQSILLNQARLAAQQQQERQAQSATPASGAAASAGPSQPAQYLQAQWAAGQLPPQPAPLVAVSLLPDGRIDRPRFVHMGQAELAMAAAASAWTPDIPKKRSFQEAFSSLLFAF